MIEVRLKVPKFMSGSGDYVEQRDNEYWTIGPKPEKLESGVIFEIALTDHIEMRIGGLTVVHRSPEK